MPTASAEQAIYDRLIGHTALTDLIGTRLWPDESKQDPELPFVLYQRTNAVRVGTLAGAGGLRLAEVAIDVFAVTAVESQTIGKLIEDRLDSWRDSSVGVQGCFVEPGDSQETEWGRTLSLVAKCWFSPVA